MTRLKASLTARDSRDIRSDADGRTMPGCVARPPRDVHRYRGADHRHCHHPTPLITGYRRCAGDPACNIRLPANRPNTVCGWHEELLYGLNRPVDRLEQLMGAKPDRTVPVLA